MKKIKFHINGQKLQIRERESLRRFISSIFKKEGNQLKSLDIIFSSDIEILNLNKKFLNHHFFTDVLAFDLSDSQEITAEIYISVPRVRENADLNKVSINQELHRVIFHGVLHLCNYDDKSGRKKKKMIGVQEKYLKLYLDN